MGLPAQAHKRSSPADVSAATASLHGNSILAHETQYWTAYRSHAVAASDNDV